LKSRKRVNVKKEGIAGINAVTFTRSAQWNLCLLSMTKSLKRKTLQRKLQDFKLLEMRRRRRHD